MRHLTDSAREIRSAARAIRGAKLSAAPCPWLPALSIFDDEHYENYDYDLVGPGERRKIVRALGGAGYRQKSGRVLVPTEGDGPPLEFPKPTRLLAGDPAAELEALLARERSIPFATPTQVLLVTLRRMVDGVDAEATAERLVALVREQPANLDKVRDWVRGDAASRFRRLRPRFEEAQSEGFELRRRGRFRSVLSG